MSGAPRAVRVQLWSYNYDPEPTGIAPVSRAWARALADRGHEVSVVAAHPHYPAPNWGRRLRPYREVRDGIPVLRLPLWIGRASGAQRIRQELSYALSHTLALPWLGRPDAIVAVSPSFPALAPAILAARLRRVPWFLWLQDILPDGAATTGMVESGAILSAARRLERAAYASATGIFVISESFEDNLRRKGVPEAKLVRAYNPATRLPAAPVDVPAATAGPPRVLCMGNIGHSQGLAAAVEAFESSPQAERAGARLVITGDGVAAASVRSAIRTDRVSMLGLVGDAELERELAAADFGLVTQRPDVAEFNVPSKLMNFMAYGLPVVAFVRPESEVARIVERSGGGWVVDCSAPAELGAAIAAAAADAAERARRGAAAREFAAANFTPGGLAERFEGVLGAAAS